MSKPTTPAYDAVNTQDTKLPVLVLQIEGLPYVFTSAQAFTGIRYDDPGVFYDGTFVYDGLRPVSSDVAKQYIDRKGSQATISQKLEQWDGKASVETLNIKLVDVNTSITALLAPGLVLSEILNRRVKVLFGYQNISYPEDYIRIFSGFINEYDVMPGAVLLKFTDPSSKRKQEIFNNGVTTLTTGASPTDTSLFVTSNGFMYQTILNGKGINDPSVTIGLVIGDEIITYVNSGINVNGVQVDSVVRGAFGTTATSHSAGDQVEAFISIDDNPINIALKVMLSGWNGPCFTNQALRGIVNTDDGNFVPDSITFNQGVDLIRDFGLTEGDFITLSSSSHPANNDTFTIGQFINNNRSVIVVETGVLVQENPPTATVAAFRSQFDTLPLLAGIQLTTDDVATAQHIFLRDTFIQFNFIMSIKGSETSGKDWIETHLMKPIAAYTLTQGSRISMGLTHPPLFSDLSKVIDHTNVIKPDNVKVNRGLNTRFFYNEVLFNYGYNPISGDFSNSIVVEDADAQNRMQQISTLEIDVRGLPDNPTSANILKQRAERILLRYRYSAELIELFTKFGTGHTIDAGDIAILTDKKTNGVKTPILKISNTEDGTRGVYDRVMEVQERTIMLTDGNAKLRLLSNVGFFLTDRYAVISPSSVISTVYSTSRFKVQESFGGRFPGQEFLKWTKYQGLLIKVHSPDFTRNGTVTYTLDTSNQFIFNTGTPLSFTPQVGDIVTLADYQEDTADDQAAVKGPFAYLSRTGIVTSGASTTVFTLNSGQGANYVPGVVVYVSSPDGTTRFSPEVKIISIVGDTITIGAILTGGTDNLGFTPVSGDLMKLGGFKDFGQSYRFI